MFFAAFLVQKRELFTTAGPHASSAWSCPAPATSRRCWWRGGCRVGVLVLERDLGTSLLFFGIVLVLLYAATERVSWMVIGLLFFVGRRPRSPTSCSATSSVRVQVWLDPFADFDGAGYQIGQALFGLGTGGVGGTGLGRGPARPRAVRRERLHAVLARRGARA